jgi:hypothetical protein
MSSSGGGCAFSNGEYSLYIVYPYDIVMGLGVVKGVRNGSLLL